MFLSLLNADIVLWSGSRRWWWEFSLMLYILLKLHVGFANEW